MVELRNVGKTFGSTVAVESVSFSARPGGVFGLIGPNGAGKSTTIRMIMNILEPDTGEVRFDGRKITENDKARIGYLPEERGLYKKVTVNEMLMYLARLKSADPTFAQKNIDAWLEKFDLLAWKNKKIEELSKGMSQKVQFIAAVAHDPDILFFDEPFSGLDPVSSDLLKNTIIEIGRQGKTILISTHVMDHAERICSEIFLMNRGTEVVSGPIHEVKSRYGRRSVTIEFDGDGSFMKTIPEVRGLNAFPRYTELELADGATGDDVLRRIVGRVSVKRFELTAPSLHKIFIDLVGAKPGQTPEVPETPEGANDEVQADE